MIIDVKVKEEQVIIKVKKDLKKRASIIKIKQCRNLDEWIYKIVPN